MCEACGQAAQAGDQFAHAALGLVVAFGVSISDTQQAAIVTALERIGATVELAGVAVRRIDAARNVDVAETVMATFREAFGDQFQFAYTPISGDFSLTTYLAERIWSPGSEWGKVGVTARQSGWRR